jgi:hypothetical protein
VEAAVHLPDYGGVTGWAALHWGGARWFDGRDRPVVLAVGAGSLRAHPGWRPSKERLRPEDLTVVDGLRVTVPVRSVLFEMRYAASLRAAVQVADLALASDLVSLAELWHHVDDRLNGWIGVEQAREALGRAVESCWSPPESTMRQVWEVEAGLSRPLANPPVFGLDGRHLFTPDLLDPVCGLVGEYDGAEFHSGARRAIDLDRDETYRRHGLEPVVMVAGDLADTSRFRSRLVSARARALGSGAVVRRWTTDPPRWWRPTDTVEQRRALSPADRARLTQGRSSVWLSR